MSEPAELDRLAFPFQARFGDDVMEPSFGMTMRDWFAGHALNGMGTWCPCRGDGYAPSGEDAIRRAKAEWAYAQADAMLAAREQGK